ncbi:MAG: 16S rRNA (cytidine(1402)-2'-O)-methyltransferase [Patescibacteria group bacterium]|jgi:16S rRNA (cytidine1402-2'-O)-methyltransferase
MSGQLYIVATPIGNLGDITARAAEILKKADIIACEDTRHTIRLLEHLGIRKTLISYHQHSHQTKVGQLIDHLKKGETVAVVSDAGTPGVNDPGNLLVRQVIEQTDGSVQISAIPGPCALVAAASISGLPTDRFTFLGFMPHKKGRETLLKQIAANDETNIFYESTHRIMKTLERLNELLEPDRPMVITRELTKKFEERIGETVGACLERLKSHPESQKGEFVVIVGAK